MVGRGVAYFVALAGCFGSYSMSDSQREVIPGLFVDEISSPQYEVTIVTPCLDLDKDCLRDNGINELQIYERNGPMLGHFSDFVENPILEGTPSTLSNDLESAVINIYSPKDRTPAAKAYYDRQLTTALVSL